MVLMRADIERFVASLAIPEERRAVVLAELLDHVASARELANREGRDPDAAERAALGELESMRAAFETVEPAFEVTRTQAFVRAILAATAVAILVDRIGHAWFGVPAAVLAVAIGALFAPPAWLAMLRAELRAPRIGGVVLRGVPIGPAITYAYTVMSTPFVIWIGMIVVRAMGGFYKVDVPWSAFMLMAVTYGVLAVEGVRARRTARA